MNESEEFKQKLKLIVKKTKEVHLRLKLKRDRLNNSRNKSTQDRNKLNRQVKQGHSEAKQLREQREAHNFEVKKAKKTRTAAIEEIRRIKTAQQTPTSSTSDVVQPTSQGRINALAPKTSESNESITMQERQMRLKLELQKAMKAQASAHEMVSFEAKQAQTAHDQMIELNTKCESLRSEAESYHRKIRVSRKEADRVHREYIIALRCFHASKDILRAMSFANSEAVNKEMNEHPIHHAQENLISTEAPSLDEEFDRLGL